MAEKRIEKEGERRTKNDLYAKFMKAFQNPTKLSIMFLLTQRKDMTVTQMSNYVGVTRANLYYAISELMQDGIVSKPDARVKKNYVEKYYHLNEQAFKSIDPVEQERRLMQDATPSDYREILRSFLSSLSLFFKLYEQNITQSPMERIKTIASDFRNRSALLSISTLDDEGYAYELKELRSLLNKMTQREKASKTKKSGETSSDLGENRVFIVALPKSAASFSA